MSDYLPLADYLKLAANFHVICVMSDPANMTRRIFCACGWKSEPESWPYNTESFESFVPQVKAHFELAKKETLSDEQFQARWQKFYNQTAIRFFYGS